MRKSFSISRNAAVFLFSAVIAAACFYFWQAAHAESVPSSPLYDGNMKYWTVYGGTHTSHIVNTDYPDTTSVSSTNIGDIDTYISSTSSIPNGAKITDIHLLYDASLDKPGITSSTVDMFYQFNSVTSTYHNVILDGFTANNLTTTTTWNGINQFKSSTSTLGLGFRLADGDTGARVYTAKLAIIYNDLFAPTYPSVINLSSTSQKVSWTDATSAESSYVVERLTNAISGSWSSINTEAMDATSSTVSGLSSNTVYCYRVGAKNWVVTKYSDIVCKATETYYPNAGFTLSSAVTAGSYIQLTWTDTQSNEDGYIVERSTDGLSYAKLGTVKFNSTKFADYDVSSGNTYYYRVTAYNDYSNGSRSTTSIYMP